MYRTLPELKQLRGKRGNNLIAGPNRAMTRPDLFLGVRSSRSRCLTNNLLPGYGTPASSFRGWLFRFCCRASAREYSRFDYC